MNARTILFATLSLSAALAAPRVARAQDGTSTAPAIDLSGPAGGLAVKFGVF